jgi:carbon-monoxide dehydrogenase medium subunit
LVREAVKLLDQGGGDAKVLSGGHSLIPLLKLRLAGPSLLVDVGRIPELRSIRSDGEDLVIGALSTYHDVERSSLLKKRCPLLPLTAQQVGDIQVRNRGTIGGGLVHADPAADLPAAIVALDARMTVVGPGGSREIGAADFFPGMLQSALESNEILSEIRVRRSSSGPGSGNGSAYFKMPQSASGFALVGVAATLSLSNGSCSDIRIGITGVAPTPFRAREAEASLKGSGLDEQALRSACTTVARGVEALSDIHASAEYRKELAAIYARRAVAAAAADAHS